MRHPSGTKAFRAICSSFFQKLYVFQSHQYRCETVSSHQRQPFRLFETMALLHSSMSDRLKLATHELTPQPHASEFICEANYGSGFAGM